MSEAALCKPLPGYLKAAWLPGKCMVPLSDLTAPPCGPPHLSPYACCAWPHPKLAAQCHILSLTALDLQACCACPALLQAECHLTAWLPCPVPTQAGPPSGTCCVRPRPRLPAPALNACCADTPSVCGLLSACCVGPAMRPSATPGQHVPAELALRPGKVPGSASCTGPGSGCRLPHRCCTCCCRR